MYENIFVGESWVFLVGDADGMLNVFLQHMGMNYFSSFLFFLLSGGWIWVC